MQELIREIKAALNSRYNEEKKAEAWTRTAKTVEMYSTEMVDQWNKEIDALLTFVSAPCTFTAPLASGRLFVRSENPRISLTARRHRKE